jgi:selenocysteine lyase/cysteine desulfurase
MIPDQRSLFSIPEQITYLNCAFTGPLLKTAQAAGEKALRAKSHPWNITAEDFFSNIETARSLFGQLIGCSENDVAIIPAVSYGIAIAAKNIPFASGQNIVVLKDQFPSNIYSWTRLAHEKQGFIKTVNRPLDHDWTKAVISTINQKTSILAIPNIHWTDGTLLDLVKIGKICRKRNIALVIDGTQSLGVMPFSVKEVKPDFLITTSHKWLLGSYSFGFCYIAQRWQKTIPLEENWLNRAGSQNFAGLVDYRDDYQKGARRFDMGAASNFLLAPVANAALKQILEWDVSRIAQTLRDTTDYIAKKAVAAGFTVPPKEQRAPNMIGITLESGIPEDLSEKLSSEQIYISIRGHSIRIAPHLYNTKEDIDRLFNSIGQIV